MAATVPVLDSIESRSIGQDSATLQFQRLERVRARLSARGRSRLIIATKLVVVPASVGVLGFTATRRTSFERLGSAGAPALVATLTPAASPATDFAFGPPAATDSAFSPTAIVPPPRRVYRVKRDATHPRRLQANANRRGRPRSHSEGRGAAAPSRDEQQDVGPVDPTAAIDWLLTTSPMSAISASHALLPNREEIPR
jgi:hypothetical protein